MNGQKRSLSDADITTYQRRAGPQGHASGTNIDTDAHTHTDSDAAPAARTDTDAVPATDRDA